MELDRQRAPNSAPVGCFDLRPGCKQNQCSARGGRSHARQPWATSINPNDADTVDAHTAEHFQVRCSVSSIIGLGGFGKGYTASVNGMVLLPATADRRRVYALAFSTRAARLSLSCYLFNSRYRWMRLQRAFLRGDKTGPPPPAPEHRACRANN